MLKLAWLRRRWSLILLYPIPQAFVVLSEKGKEERPHMCTDCRELCSQVPRLNLSLS